MSNEKLTKKQTEEQWKELYEYVKNDILNYQDKVLPKYFVLRLKGMKDGNFIKNKKTQNQANYTYKDILMTFKINKYNIHSAMNGKTFKDERHMFNFIMVIIERDINNVVDMMNRAKKSEEKGISVDSAIEGTNNKANYKKKTKEVNNKLLNNLW